MTQIEQIIMMIAEQEAVSVKGQFIGYLTNMAGSTTLNKKERDALNTLIEHELVFLKSAFSNAVNYREKNDLIGYANALMELTLAIYNDPARAPQSLLAALTQLTPIIREERFLENAIDDVFENVASLAAVERLSKTLDTVNDEYQRGMLWSGLIHYAEKRKSLTPEVADALYQLTVREFTRLFTLEKTSDVLGAIEFACDACRYHAGEEIVALLNQALTLDTNAVTFYAATALLDAGSIVSEDTVAILANDLEFACLTYESLKDHGKEALFPAELSDEIYLAKSDLVHWLVYPTELGQKPDEIEYIGTVTAEKIPYYIFRFRSDSDTLDDEAKNQWLIGWSAAEGNTFSEFELYSDYEDKTPEKTLKNIKKKILY